MKNVAAILLVLGIGSSVLSFTNYEMRLLMWIETWGPGVAWAIRGGLIVVGLGLLLAGRKARSA